MVNRKLLITNIVFVAAAMVIFLMAISVEKTLSESQMAYPVKSVEKVYFKDVEFFVLEKGQSNFEMEASELTIFDKTNYILERPEGSFFSTKGEEVHYNAQKGSLNSNTKELNLEGDILITTKDGEYESQSLYYNHLKEFFEARDSVKAYINEVKTGDRLNVSSNYLSSWLDEKRSLFLGDVKGQIKRKLRYEGGIKFAAQKMEMINKESLIKLNDEVSIQRNNYDVSAGKADIFMENFNKKLKYFILYDDIKFEEKMQLDTGKTSSRRAFSEKLEAIVSEGKVILSGAPRVEQEGDLIKGYQITLRENIEFVEVDDSQTQVKFKKKE